MGQVDIEESLLVGAPPDVVYKILADPAHHKHILPEAFVSYESEGDGIVSFSIKLGAVKRDFRVRTEQTEPNKLFREIDLSTNIATEFSLEPHPDGSVVTIATHYTTESSLSGFMEAMFGPVFLRQIYKEELVKLGRYALLVK